MDERVPERTLQGADASNIGATDQDSSFMVTRNGVPVAEIVPIRKKRPHFVRREELAAMVDLGPRLDAAAWRADLYGTLDQHLD